SNDPHMRTPIRNGDASNYTLMVGDEKIGEIDYWHLIREAYPKGIYLHGGRYYRVRDVFRNSRTVSLVQEFTRNLTVPVINTSFSKRMIASVTEFNDIIIHKGTFEVTARLISVSEKKRDGETVKH